MQIPIESRTTARFSKTVFFREWSNTPYITHVEHEHCDECIKDDETIACNDRTVKKLMRHLSLGVKRTYRLLSNVSAKRNKTAEYGSERQGRSDGSEVCNLALEHALFSRYLSFCSPTF